MSDIPLTSRDETKKFLGIIYMNLIEKLLERIIKVTEVDEEIAVALRQHMLKPMLFHIVEDVAPVWYE